MSTRARGCACRLSPGPLSCEALVTQGVQEPAHRLELQADLAPQPHAGPRCHLVPKASELRELECALAHVGQALPHLPEAGGGVGPGTGGQARRGHDLSSGSWLATNQEQGQTLHPPCSGSWCRDTWPHMQPCASAASSSA